MNAADRLLVLEATVLLFFTWAGLCILPFSILRRLVDDYAGKSDTSVRVKRAPDRVAWAVIVVARRLPVPTTCLVQGLAADAMLRRHGFASQLRLGVRRRENSLKPLVALEAHAWVECEGRIMVGEREDLADYAVLTATGRS